MRGQTGPLVDFIVVSHRSEVRIAEGAWPEPGSHWYVASRVCIVRRLVEVAPGRLRAWVEPDATKAPPNPSLSLFVGPPAAPKAGE